MKVLTFLMALIKGIADVSFGTGTGRHMVDDSTVRVNATSIPARVHTLVGLAGLCSLAVRIKHALWPAAEIRVTEESFRTGTDAGVASNAGPGARPARAGLTLVGRWRRRRCGWI